MHIEYQIFYKEKDLKEIHFHSQVLYRETAVCVCRHLEAEGKKPWFEFVKVEN